MNTTGPRNPKQVSSGVFAAVLFWAIILSVPCTSADLSTFSHHMNLYLTTGPSGAGVTQDVQNFPVLVRLSGSDAPGLFGDARSDGGDIRFAKSDGSELLPYEMVRYDPYTDSIAEFWVLVDTVYGGNDSQSIMMAWGNYDSLSLSSASDVFLTGNGFAGVWHLDYSSADSTSWGRIGTENGVIDTLAVSGWGKQFDGISSYISYPNDAGLSQSGALTLSFWSKFDQVNPFTSAIVSKGSNTYEMILDSMGTPSFRIYDGSAQHVVTADIAANVDTWYHISGVYDGSSEMVLFIDGQRQSGIASPPGLATSTSSLVFGHDPMGAHGFMDGVLDEVRLSGTARDSSWIKLSYENQRVGQKLVQTKMRFWDGGGTDNLASTAGNWKDDIVPSAGEHIVLDGISGVSPDKDMEWDLDIAVGSWRQMYDYSGTVIVNTGYSTGLDSMLVMGDCIVEGGVIKHKANGTSKAYRLKLVVGGELRVGSMGAIRADSLGYSAGSGPSAGSGSDGAGHGGRGGDYDAGGPSGWMTYGDFRKPEDLGSGSGSSAGGGAIWIDVEKRAIIDGSVSARGAENGGAGGSVYLRADSLGGYGTISASGGYSSTGAGGGGGRVSVIIRGADTTGGAMISASGGGGYVTGMAGAAGTVYLEFPSDSGRGTLKINNWGYESAAEVVTDIRGDTPFLAEVGAVRVQDGARFVVGADDTLVLSGPDSNLTVAWASMVDSGALVMSGTIFPSDSSPLTFASGSVVKYKGRPDNAAVTIMNKPYSTLVLENSGTMFSAPVGDLVIDSLVVRAGDFIQQSFGLRTNALVVGPDGAFRNLADGADTIGSGGLHNEGIIELDSYGGGCGDTDAIVVRSTVTGTQVPWSGTGIFSLTDIDVMDQGGSAPVKVLGGTNSGNLGANWTVTTSCSSPPRITGRNGASALDNDTKQRPDGSGIVEIGYELYDVEQESVTVSVEFYDGVGWSAVGPTGLSGDIGMVSAGDSLGDRMITWDFGMSMGATEISGANIRLIARDSSTMADTVSRSASDWYLDFLPPTSVSISFQNDTTSDCTPVFTLGATGADSVRYGFPSDTGSVLFRPILGIDSVDICSSSDSAVVIMAQFVDKMANRSGWVADTIEFVPGSDTIGPDPVDYVSATIVSCTTMVVSWPAPLNSDVESTVLCLSSDAMPLHPDSGAIRRTLPPEIWSDTVSGLDGNGVMYNVAIFMRDSSGNWSKPDTSAQTTLTLYDCVAPVNKTKLVLQSRGDTAITMSYVLDSADHSDLSRVFLYVPSQTVPVASSFNISLPPRDTSIVREPIQTPGWWYAGVALIDSSGNLSPLHVDSVSISNVPPRLFFESDSIVKEDSLMVFGVTSSDFNGDAMTLSVVEAPEGMWIGTDDRYHWVPNDTMVGVQRFVFQCEDSRGGTTIDSFAVTVLNAPDKPDVTLSGTEEAVEDSFFQAEIVVKDPDQGDSFESTILYGPSWLTLSGDTLLVGVPGQKDIGTDTIMVEIMDRDGLKDTARMVIEVLPVNDPPTIVESTLPDTGWEQAPLGGFVKVRDPDSNDSVRVVWEKRPSWLQLEKTDHGPGDTLWVFNFEGIPSQTDTGAQEFSLLFTDSRNASVRHAGSINVIAVNHPPSVSITSVTTAGGAARVVLRATDDRDTTIMYAVKLARVGQGSIDSSAGLTPTFDFFPLSDGEYEVRALAFDSEGAGTLKPAIDTFKITGVTKRPIGSGKGWQMVSVPADSSDADSVRGGGGILTRWDESMPVRDIYRFYQPTNEIRFTRGGQAFWRKGDSSAAISIPPERILRDTVTVKLSKSSYGWNQIANPFVFPVAWNEPLTLWKWNGQTGDFEEAGGRLDPWAGYFVLTDSARSVGITPEPVFETTALAKKAKAFFVSPDRWQVQLVLRGETTQDADNTIGFSSDARDDLDTMDRPEPPRMPGSAYLYLPRTQWHSSVGEFASDIRREYRDLNAFEIALVSPNTNEKSRFSVHGVSNLQSVFLFLADKDTVIPLVEGMQHPIMSNGVMHKTIFATSDKDFLKRFPSRFQCAAPYPNPFGPVVRIKYTLPFRWKKDGRLDGRPYRVELIVLDARGRVVRHLVDREQDPGNYEIVWRAKTNSGRPVASGAYFCRLSAGEFRSVQRIVTVR